MSSYSEHIVTRYFERSGQPRPSQLDAAYHYEWSVLRDMLARLEVILDDEGVPCETAERVVRCLVYGAPSAAGAEQRMANEKALRDLMARVPPLPLTSPDAMHLGLPPK